MKKLLVVLIVSFVILQVNMSIAEISYGEMTTDELIKLRNDISDELDKRIGEEDGNMIFVGDYIAGIDIKPGTYIITCTDKPANQLRMVFAVYEAGDKYETNKGKAVYSEFQQNRCSLSK